MFNSVTTELSWGSFNVTDFKIYDMPFLINSEYITVIHRGYFHPTKTGRYTWSSDWLDDVGIRTLGLFELLTIPA